MTKHERFILRNILGRINPVGPVDPISALCDSFFSFITTCSEIPGFMALSALGGWKSKSSPTHMHQMPFTNHMTACAKLQCCDFMSGATQTFVVYFRALSWEIQKLSPPTGASQDAALSLHKHPPDQWHFLSIRLTRFSARQV